MNKNVTRGVVIACLLALSGCAAVLIGGGVAGGIAIAKDTVELNLDKRYDTVWAVCLKEISAMGGTVTLRDKQAGTIQATIRETNLELTLTRLTPQTVQTRIKARKNLFPDIETATALSNRISARL